MFCASQGGRVGVGLSVYLLSEFTRGMMATSHLVSNACVCVFVRVGTGVHAYV